MPTSRVAHRAAVVLALAGTCLAGFSLAGCDERSQARKDLESAMTQVRTVGLSAPEANSVHEGVSKAVPSINNAAQTGTAGEQAAASILQAQTALSAGEVSARAAQQAELRVRQTLGRLSAYSSEWSHLNTLASSAASFDPSSQVSALQAQMAEKDQQVAAKRQELARTEQEVRDLRGQAEAQIEAAGALQRQAAELSQQAARLSAREGLELVERSAGLRRQGDAKRLAGEQLLAQADQIAPNIKEAQTIIQQYENQKTKLDEARRDLLDRQTQSRRNSEDSRTLASQAQQLIATELREMSTLLADEYTPAFEKATGEYSLAATSARKAGASSASGKLLAGSAQSSLAGLHYSRARLMSSVASVANVLANVSPALDQQSSLASQFADAQSKEQEAISSAKGAFEEAKASFGGVQLRGEEKEKLQKLGEMIDRFLQGGSASDPTASNTDAPAESAPLSAAPADGVPAEAKAVLASLAEATNSGRFEDAVALYHATSEGGRKILESTQRSAGAAARLDKALRAKFNTGFAEAMQSNPMLAQGAAMMGNSGGMGDGTLDLAGISYAMSGSDVVASGGSLPTPLTIVNVDGAWKLSGAQFDTMAENPMAAMQIQMAPKVADAMDAIAKRVDAGEFPDAASAMNAFMDSMMQSMMPPPGGG